PIRDLVTILEALSDYAGQTKDLGLLTEYVRQSLNRIIYSLYQDEEGKVMAITLAPEVEKTIAGMLQSAMSTGAQAVLPPRFVEGVTAAVKELVNRMSGEGLQPLMICSPSIRQYFKRLIEPVFPNLVVISYAELPQTVEVKSYGTVQIEMAGVTT
ncbi:MAG: FHIPEP family type III secretion protein, partial [Gemmatimonadota bacterium]|nr:FHIPEP family type III secretion protein [Gemmatimonadota bacterium]